MLSCNLGYTAETCTMAMTLHYACLVTKLAKIYQMQLLERQNTSSIKKRRKSLKHSLVEWQTQKKLRTMFADKNRNNVSRHDKQ